MSGSICSTRRSRLGIQLGARWQFWKNTHLPRSMAERIIASARGPCNQPAVQASTSQHNPAASQPCRRQPRNTTLQPASSAGVNLATQPCNQQACRRQPRNTTLQPASMHASTSPHNLATSQQCRRQPRNTTLQPASSTGVNFATQPCNQSAVQASTSQHNPATSQPCRRQPRNTTLQPASRAGVNLAT